MSRIVINRGEHLPFKTRVLLTHVGPTGKGAVLDFLSIKRSKEALGTELRASMNCGQKLTLTAAILELRKSKRKIDTERNSDGKSSKIILVHLRTEKKLYQEHLRIKYLRILQT